jgi:hypothetical protein
MLQPLSRDCFVLRIPVGLSREVCAEIPDISVPEFEDAVSDALREPPLLYAART